MTKNTLPPDLSPPDSLPPDPLMLQHDGSSLTTGLAKGSIISSIIERLVCRTKLDGRLVVLLCLSLYFGLLWVSSLFADYQQVWRHLGVPARSPSFSDLRNITSAVDCGRLGLDPLATDPCDPWQRPMNYPRVWLSLLSAFGVQQMDTADLGIALAVAFFGSLLLLVGRANAYEGLLYSLLICSPAVMLGVERGNNDLAVFVLLSLAALGLAHEGVRKFLSYVLIGICCVLKIYPVVALVVALRERPWVAAAVLAVGTTLFTLYVYAIHSDLLLISSVIPRAVSLSYGSQVLFLGISKGLHLPVEPNKLSLLALLGVIVAACLAFMKLPKPFFVLPPAHRLRIGAALYVATFAFGNNFNYRLVFLLFVVPDLLLIVKNRDRNSSLALLLLALIVAALWLSPITFVPLFLLKEALNWFLFAAFVFILLQFLPHSLWNKAQQAAATA